MNSENKISELLRKEQLCNLKHPVFNLFANQTRRNILRLISCEHNYGNQLSTILEISKPTVHRHLKQLADPDKGEFISEKKKTSESYSGFKGGDAVIYEISKKLFHFTAILPNLVHSHILDLTENDSHSSKQTRSEEINNDILPNFDTTDSVHQAYNQMYSQSQDLNDEIIDLEQQLITKLLEKNEIMRELDDFIENMKELNFNQRIILRALACLGPNCYYDLPDILNVEPFMINHFLENLISEGWLKQETDD